MKYKIAYIDESLEWINTFYQTFKYDFDIDKIHINSESSIIEITKQLIESDIDGIVTDYLLDEEGDVDFNGNKIVESVRAFKPHFPITMLTSYEPQAIQQMEDVNIIYGKDILDGDNEEKLEILKAKIKSNIERYYAKIKSTIKRIEELTAKRNKKEISATEEEELTKLFILLDELEPEGKEVKANLVTKESISQLNEFVRETKEILAELKKNKSE